MPDAEPTRAAGTPTPRPRAPRSPLIRLLVLGLVLAPQAAVLLVQGFAPVLLREAPLALLALHPFEPWSLLVSPQVAAVPFVAVMVSVRAVPYAAAYLLGRWYGERGLAMLRQGARSRRIARRVERAFTRAGGLILLLYPGALVSALAGATGMRRRRFAPLVLTGLVLWALLTRAIAEVAAGPLLVVTQFIDRSTTWLTVALLGLTVALVTRQWLVRRSAGRTTASSADAQRAAGPSTSAAGGAGQGGR